MKSLILSAIAALALCVLIGGTSAAHASGAQPKPERAQAQSHCPPRRAQAPHARATEMPFRNEARSRHGACRTGHRHSFLHRHFHQRQDRAARHHGRSY